MGEFVICSNRKGLVTIDWDAEAGIGPRLMKWDHLQ